MCRYIPKILQEREEGGQTVCKSCILLFQTRDIDFGEGLKVVNIVCGRSDRSVKRYYEHREFYLPIPVSDPSEQGYHFVDLNAVEEGLWFWAGLDLHFSNYVCNVDIFFFILRAMVALEEVLNFSFYCL